MQTWGIVGTVDELLCGFAIVIEFYWRLEMKTLILNSIRI